MITDIDVLQTRAGIDGPSFPHILDRVIAAADYEGLMALRGVNRQFNAAADARLFAHVALISPSQTGLVMKVKHRVGVAVGPGGYVFCTPSSGGLGQPSPLGSECRFLPHLPSTHPSPERLEQIKAVDYYGPKPSPCVQDLLSYLADEGAVKSWRTEADWGADADKGALSPRQGVTRVNFPLLTVDDTTFTVRAAPHTTAIVHLTWPDRVIEHDETPVIVDLFAAPGSDAYIVIEKPDPEVELPLSTLREEIGIYLGAGIAEAFLSSSSERAAPNEEASGAANVHLEHPPKVTIVGLEGLLPDINPELGATFTQRALGQLVAYIAERYGVRVEQHVSAMSLEDWEADFGSRGDWAHLATDPHLPYTSNEVALSCELRERATRQRPTGGKDERAGGEGDECKERLFGLLTISLVMLPAICVPRHRTAILPPTDERHAQRDSARHRPKTPITRT